MCVCEVTHTYMMLHEKELFLAALVLCIIFSGKL